ncbi:AAA family ATPase [Paenibacillus cremeus]|uniref:AAA family ATPase n=1 Tax=Paenibacillus cremeus TaxID=2163881 RepID=A0A559KDB1_9BACL|nr:AAA family ATPase [Paenibacillus cremeus]TVY10120.1 AAA family ATPase [Paenibacillus cremeus]
MRKMTLVLLDSDRYFSEMLSVFIRTSEYADRFTIHCFSSKPQGLQFLEETQEPFILLVQETWLPLPETLARLKLGCTVLISDHHHSVLEVDYPVLCKFQPLDRLLSEVAAHYNDYCAVQQPLLGSRSTRVIAVYSTVGGAGKTVTALQIAKQLTLHGERVCCVSFERLPSYAWYPVQDAAGAEAFSSMVYYAKMNPKLLSSKIERWKSKHPVMKFDYIPPLAHLREWQELTEDDAASILQGLVDAKLYDVLVLDLDSILNDVMRQLLVKSDQVLWLLLDDVVYLQKTVTSLSEFRQTDEPDSWLDLKKKISFVQNKRTGAPLNDFEGLGFRLSGALPYVPDWKAIGRLEQLSSPMFAEAAAELVRSKESEVVSLVV